MASIAKFALCAAVAATALSSCHKSDTDRSDDLQSVSVAHPVVDSVTLYKTYPGRLSASREVALVARVNGYIVEKDYESGQEVTKGKILFRIEDHNYRDALQKAQAALESARADREYAAHRYEAMKEALKGDAVSEIEVAQAKNNLTAAEAQVSTAAAAVQTARTQLDYCTVRAPFDGRMSTNNFSVGSFVAGEGSPVTLATIYEDSHMTANFAIDDNESLGAFKRNLADKSVNLDSIPMQFDEVLPHSYTGSFSYLAPNVNTSTGTITVQADIANPYYELSSGMFVKINLPTGTIPKALMIKDAAIATNQLGKYVYVVNDSNRVVYTPIEVGALVRDSMRIVTRGLEPTDRYITKALLKVRNDMVVNPIDTK